MENPASKYIVVNAPLLKDVTASEPTTLGYCYLVRNNDPEQLQTNPIDNTTKNQLIITDNTYNDKIITHNNNHLETSPSSTVENQQQNLSQLQLVLEIEDGTTNRHIPASKYCELITILKHEQGNEFQDNIGAFQTIVEMLLLDSKNGQNNAEEVKWGFKAMIALAADVLNLKKFKNSLASVTCKVVVDGLRLWGQINSEIAHDGCTLVGILICSSSSTKKKLKQLGAAEVVKNALVNPFMNKSDKEIVLSWLR
jgi:hypothetical protein